MREGTTVDRYVVEGVAGAGAVGTVYRVRHASLGTQHALKIVASTSPAARLRFEREARMQASLRHPNIVRVTDVLEVAGQPALVAEFVNGPNLAELMAQEQLPLVAALDLFGQIVDGVGAAHAQGIVHRDLKPHNVLIETVDGQMVPRVSDFGIAGWLDKGDAASLTRTGIAMGTPAYMAPEQHDDAGRVDGRADIWSLGCILFELATGRRPFDGTTLVKLAMQVSMGEYPPPSTVKAGLPAALDQLIADCLQTDPAKRLGTCEALHERVAEVTLQARNNTDDIAALSPPKLGGTGVVGSAVIPSMVTWGQQDVGDLSVVGGDAPKPAKLRLALGIVLLLAFGGLAVGGALLWTGSKAVKGDVDGPAAATLSVTAQPAAEAVDSDAAAPDSIDLAGDATGESSGTQTQDSVASTTGGGSSGSVASSVETAAASTPSAGTSSSAAPSSPDPSPRAQAAGGGSSQEEGASSATTSGSIAPATAVGAASETPLASFTVVGKGVTLRLVGKDGIYGPGPVPAGRYLVRARFSGEEERDAGYVSIRPSEVTAVVCDAVFMQCRRQE